MMIIIKQEIIEIMHILRSEITRYAKTEKYSTNKNEREKKK